MTSGCPDLHIANDVSHFIPLSKPFPPFSDFYANIVKTNIRWRTPLHQAGHRIDAECTTGSRRRGRPGSKRQLCSIHAGRKRIRKTVSVEIIRSRVVIKALSYTGLVKRDIVQQRRGLITLENVVDHQFTLKVKLIINGIDNIADVLYPVWVFDGNDINV